MGISFIIQLVHHCINVINLSLSTSMDSVFQHGSSSGYIHDGPDFLIAQQHLQAVADMLASTTFQAMDVDPRADATASLSAIRAILSPESREIRTELAEEAKPDAAKMHITAAWPRAMQTNVLRMPGVAKHCLGTAADALYV